MPVIDSFGLEQRLVVWIRQQPSRDVLEKDLGVILNELREMHPPRLDLGTRKELWDALVKAEDEDEALGNHHQWRSFVLIAWSYLPGDSVVSGVPTTIRFLCPRVTWRVDP